MSHGASPGGSPPRGAAGIGVTPRHSLVGPARGLAAAAASGSGWQAHSHSDRCHLQPRARALGPLPGPVSRLDRPGHVSESLLGSLPKGTNVLVMLLTATHAGSQRHCQGIIARVLWRPKSLWHLDSW
jgi:hypothetical protein